MEYADLHIHALCGVDDGAKTEAEMQAMVDASYADGTRVICVTPHYHPGYFGHNSEKTEWAFQTLTFYVQDRYPDMQLYLGNELRYSRDCVSWLQSGQCRTLNGTQYILVDFPESAEEKKISDGLAQLLNVGYRPVLAHVERYRSLWGKMHLLRSYSENSILFQVDAQSLVGGFGYRTQHQSRRLLEAGLIELICSDSHDICNRPPKLSQCFQFVQRKYGADCAQALFLDNGLRLLHEGATREE